MKRETTFYLASIFSKLAETEKFSLRSVEILNSVNPETPDFLFIELRGSLFKFFIIDRGKLIKVGYFNEIAGASDFVGFGFLVCIICFSVVCMLLADFDKQRRRWKENLKLILAKSGPQS